MNVAREFVKVRLGLDEDILKSALKEMAGSLVATIDMRGVMLVEPLQASTEMALWGLEVKVIVIGHQTIGMNDDPPAMMSLSQ